MQWTWDPEKDRINQLKHGINFETAQLVFDDPFGATQREDFYEGELRWNTIGVVGNLTLWVVHTWPYERCETWSEIGRIISARRANSHERRLYEERIF